MPFPSSYVSRNRTMVTTRSVILTIATPGAHSKHARALSLVKTAISCQKWVV